MPWYCLLCKTIFLQVLPIDGIYRTVYQLGLPHSLVPTRVEAFHVIQVDVIDELKCTILYILAIEYQREVQVPHVLLLTLRFGSLQYSIYRHF
jgi:hypothetical protein